MNYFFKKQKNPIIIAHRGAPKDAPENTLASFREAIRQKTDAIEFDVQMTKDNWPIIIHDPTVNRTTTGKGIVHHMSLDQIKALDAGIKFGKHFRDERIPTLDEVLDTFGKTTNYVVELKFYRLNTNRFSTRVYDAVASRNLLEKVMFLSFDPRPLIKIKQSNPNAKTCWAFIPFLGWTPPKWAIKSFDALAIAQRQAKANYIKRLRALGKPVNIWVRTDRKEDFQDELSSDTDFITTNHPAKLRSEIAKSSAPPATRPLKK